MGFRFRKSVSLGAGTKINFNKNSVGVSFGTKGMRYSVNSDGRKTSSVGAPGTGLYYTQTEYSSSNKKQSAANNSNNIWNNKTCKKCGAVVFPTDKVCKNCGYNLENKNLPTIIWLLIFFPVGLYFMWAKTNWNKIVKITISAFIAACCLISTFSIFSADDLPEIQTSQTGITELKLINNNIVELDISSSFYNTENSFVSVKCNDEFKLEDIEFISMNPEIAKIEYSKTLLDTHVYYDITAVSPGETTVYVQTKDGIIKSEEIKVVVIGEVTTKEATTENITEETITKKVTTTENKTNSEIVTNTEKQTTTKKNTTTQKQTTTEVQKDRPEINSNYVINTNTNKFHRPGCYTIEKIDNNNLSQSNKSYDELVNGGYSPCKKCLN